MKRVLKVEDVKGGIEVLSRIPENKYEYGTVLVDKKDQYLGSDEGDQGKPAIFYDVDDKNWYDTLISGLLNVR